MGRGRESRFVRLRTHRACLRLSFRVVPGSVRESVFASIPHLRLAAVRAHNHKIRLVDEAEPSAVGLASTPVGRRHDLAEISDGEAVISEAEIGEVDHDRLRAHASR